MMTQRTGLPVVRIVLHKTMIIIKKCGLTIINHKGLGVLIMTDLKDMATKTYDNGSTGNYICTCCICDVSFWGHKRDLLCGKDHKEDEGDCKHCFGTGYIENPLWMGDKDEVANICFVCGGEG
jgi:hypothetical protein